jgi:hypothetical protein
LKIGEESSRAIILVDLGLMKEGWGNRLCSSATGAVSADEEVEGTEEMLPESNSGSLGLGRGLLSEPSLRLANNFSIPWLMAAVIVRALSGGMTRLEFWPTNIFSRDAGGGRWVIVTRVPAVQAME